MSTPAHPAVHIVPADEYAELVAERNLLANLICVMKGADDDVALLAGTFLDHFEPERGEEGGHIAYCIRRAFDAALEHERSVAIAGSPGAVERARIREQQFWLTHGGA